MSYEHDAARYRNVARASPSPNKVEYQVIRITMIRWSSSNTRRAVVVVVVVVVHENSITITPPY